MCKVFVQGQGLETVWYEFESLEEAVAAIPGLVGKYGWRYGDDGIVRQIGVEVGADNDED